MRLVSRTGAGYDDAAFAALETVRTMACEEYGLWVVKGVRMRSGTRGVERESRGVVCSL